MNEGSITESDILACLRNGEQAKRGGYQGNVRICDIGENKVLIKSAAGRGIAAWLNRWLLRREYRIYGRLAGVMGVPHCHGFFMGRYLVLQHIESLTLRNATIRDRSAFFAEMFKIIETIHERGVAHGDLKRRDNILVTDNSHPCLVDFGVSVFRKPGFRPLNHFWHGFARQHDLNAWLKHKYNRRLEDMSPEDAEYYRPLRIERLARLVKRAWTRPTRPTN